MGPFMPLVIPLATAAIGVGGSVIANKMNKPPKQPKMLGYKSPSTLNQDQTPGVIRYPGIMNAASQSQLSSSQSVSNHLLGG